MKELSMKFIITLQIFFVFLSTMVSASDNPTYQETTNFILQKTKYSVDYFPNSSPAYRVVKLISFPSNCIMRADGATITNGRKGDVHYETYDLSKVDPSTIKTNPPVGVIFSSTGGEDVFRTVSGSSNFLYKNGTIRVAGAERNFQKVAKALSHLVKLCGGKEELF